MVSLSGCSAISDAPTGTAHVRVAHLSPDAPNVDFCVAPHGTASWTGPILASNGHMTGLAYGNATKYFDLDATQYDVRLVPPAQPDCTMPLANLPDITDLPDLPADAFATLGAEGLVTIGASTAFVVKAYIDDSTVDPSMAKLRFIHASPGTPAVDLGIGGGALFTSVFSDIAFGNASSVTNGYVTVAPITGAEVSVRPHGTFADALAIKPASLPAGAIATAFAIGELASTTTPLRALLCIDNAAPMGLLSSCSVVGGTPERAHIRMAHLSPDTPNVDICVAPSGGAFGAEFLKTLGASSGLAYAQVTAYVDVPTGSYDMRIIHATASDCSIGDAPDTKGIAVHDDDTATIAAIGVLDASGAAANDPALQLAVFSDETNVASSMTKLRFVHASPGTPAVDVGLGQGQSFSKVFADVAFGKVAIIAPEDADGFVQTTPVTSAVAARIANSSSDALVVPGVTLAANGIATAFAVGNKTGASDHPLQVLLCGDNAAANGLLAACTLAP
jgi:uncharacterized protein DUF4397